MLLKTKSSIQLAECPIKIKTVGNEGKYPITSHPSKPSLVIPISGVAFLSNALAVRTKI